jgi:selenocysteine-specific elongation factor
VLIALAEAGVSPPTPAELMTRLRVSEDLIQALIDQGELVSVAPDLIYRADTFADMVIKIRELIAEHGSVTVATARDALDTSRKYALALLEHLDERRITRRVGDTRVLGSG